MEFWSSSEAQFDVDELLNAARKDIERELKALVASQDYGAGVSKWALIYILLAENDPNYPEVRRFKKRTRVVEFRLKVSHEAFKQANEIAQRRLLGAAVLRSIDLSRDLKIPDFNANDFKTKVVQILENNNWL